MFRSGIKSVIATAVTLFIVCLTPSARGHCDTLNGPVVMEAKKALESGDVTPVLKWVTAADEAEIRSVFERVSVVRKQGNDAKALADQFFFETLVRVHRAAEGMPYTGIKYDTGQIAPASREADAALADRDVERLVALVTKRVAADIRKRFDEATQAQSHVNESLAAGRTFVKAYVEFVHYVERVCEASQVSVHDPEIAMHAHDASR